MFKSQPITTCTYKKDKETDNTLAAAAADFQQRNVWHW